MSEQTGAGYPEPGSYRSAGPAFTEKQDALLEETPEISRAQARLAEAIGALDTVLSDLEKRIDQVLRPPEPENASAASELYVPHSSAPLTDFLSAQSSRIEVEVSRVSGLLYRLAL